MTSSSLWNYHKDEVNNDANENNAADSYSIKNKRQQVALLSIVSTPDDNNTLDIEFVVPLKYLSTFWGSLDFSLINCEIEFD